ncbi:MAG: class I SAM-dependent methyltransferase [Hydrococcus sp. Prado102]|jgi:ubiquinone/menaquinone biosynthesis C-methylase UbiE|nr:class I SAM-dependent methyltransferase [Hydrococcus sp. Prado102]
MNALERFSNRAIDYANCRPSYSKEAIAFILKGLNSSSQLIAADIGAGTGISSRQLAEQGVRVLAIEPNAEMRAVAVPHPSVEFYDSTAEKTRLADTSIDLITCFNSAHWFDTKPTLLEFKRILKPGGRLALAWQEWDESDRCTQLYNNIVFSASYPNLFKRFVEKATRNSKLALRWYEWQLHRLLRSFNFTNIRREEFADRQELDLAKLIGLARSQSFVPLTESVQEQLLCAFGQLCDRFGNENGKMYLVYRIRVYLAQNSLE